jgi:hypothetical protein
MLLYALPHRVGMFWPRHRFGIAARPVPSKDRIWLHRSFHEQKMIRRPVRSTTQLQQERVPFPDQFIYFIHAAKYHYTVIQEKKRTRDMRINR